jgi:nicotinamide phosphoribosyltransferase
MRWWRLINRYLELNGTPETTEFKMVDFGARGVSSTETAGLAGMAHLVNFQVTDNLMGIRFAKHAY